MPAPPPANFRLKDEVELLREGTKNIHGETVKSQAAGGQQQGAKTPANKDDKMTNIEI
jgi:hypothetical protein